MKILQPLATLIAFPELQYLGVLEMLDDCAEMYPYEGESTPDYGGPGLCVLAGRNCYKSFGNRGTNKSSAEYLRHVYKSGHLSVLYHAHYSFYLRMSRRVLQEFIRHYVGAHGDTDGAPSVESTRFCLVPPHFVWPEGFPVPEGALGAAHDSYLSEIRFLIQSSNAEDVLKLPRKERKSVLERAGRLLPDATCTTMVWTANIIAIHKMYRERTAEGVDPEFQALAAAIWEKVPSVWKEVFSEGE